MPRRCWQRQAPAASRSLNSALALQSKLKPLACRDMSSISTPLDESMSATSNAMAGSDVLRPFPPKMQKREGPLGPLSASTLYNVLRQGSCRKQNSLCKLMICWKKHMATLDRKVSLRRDGTCMLARSEPITVLMCLGVCMAV